MLFTTMSCTMGTSIDGYSPSGCLHVLCEKKLSLSEMSSSEELYTPVTFSQLRV